MPTSREIRQQRQASEQSRWQDWKEERDTDDDEYPEPEPEEQQRSALQ